MKISSTLLFLFIVSAEQSFALDEKTLSLANSIAIADVHMHLRNGHDGNYYREAMKKNNVLWGGAVGGTFKDDPLKIKAELGNQYIAAVGQKEFFGVLFSAGEKGLYDLEQPLFKKLFSYAEPAFKSGQLRGFGEIHINNITPFGPKRDQRKIELTSPVVMKMFDIANRYNGFVQIHTMASSDINTLISVAAKYSNTKIILSHCMFGASTDQIAYLLSSKSNIFCELSGAGPTHFNNERFYNQYGIKEEWRILIERFPTRFMLGTDPCCGLENRYDDLVLEFRKYLLPYLKEQTIKLVANGNAKRIFNLK
jgi:predicted TIM-barrel fold metal-dependent hydrolase